MDNDVHEKVLTANKEFHDSFAEHYEEYYGNIIFFEANQRRISQNLEYLRSRTAGGVLVDVGCGTGNIGRLAETLFETRFGVDVSIRSLEKAKTHYTEVFEGDACDLKQFADHSVDLVTGYSLLHHLADPSILYRECSRILKPTGCIYFDNDPNSAYFVFSLLSYLPTSLLDRVEQINSQPESSPADAVIQGKREVYKQAEYHHHFGGRYQGFFPRTIKKQLMGLGFRNVEIQLFQIHRQKQRVKVRKFSFLSQFRYSQMAVMAQR